MIELPPFGIAIAICSGIFGELTVWTVWFLTKKDRNRLIKPLRELSLLSGIYFILGVVLWGIHLYK